MDNDRDLAAQKMFDAPYNHLSAWGKRHVNYVLSKIGKVEAPYNVSLRPAEDPARLRQDNERLSRELDSSRVEALELWDEISELKQQIAELQAQFNPST